MKLQDWFTSNLDDIQRQIVMKELDKSFIVQGGAGTGKTILALHRAMQANEFGSFAIIVYTKALKKMIEYGLRVLELPLDRAVYEWSWNNRGVEIIGDVYVELDRGRPVEGEEKVKYWPRKDVLYLKNENNIDVYELCSLERREYYETLYQNILQNIVSTELSKRKEIEDELAKFVTIDFADYVPDRIYYTFFRRMRWYEKKRSVNDIDLTDKTKYEFIPSASLYRYKVPVDYMIVDEAQDFSLEDISRFKNDALKGIVLFGDTLQQVYLDRGTSLDRMAGELRIPRFLLTYNYRLPKSVAKVAELLTDPPQELVKYSRRNNGRSDYPDFPKPFIKKCNSIDSQVDFVINKIIDEGLEDIGILVPKQQDVEYVWNYLNNRNINSQVKFNKYFYAGPFQMYRQIDTLDFSDPSIPTILTFHSAKGTQFENVFILFAENGIDRNPFYVAVTRTSRRLYITYKNRLTSLLDVVPKEYLTFLE